MSLAIILAWSKWPNNKQHTLFFNNYYPRHDFAEEHEGEGCNNEGLMSYVDSIYEEPPNAWSTCSNEDFENWYQQEGRYCLKTGNVSTRMFQMWHFLGQWSMTIGHISSQFFAITFVFSIVICFFNLQHQDHPTEPPATPYLDPTHILTADSLLYTHFQPLTHHGEVGHYGVVAVEHVDLGWDSIWILYIADRWSMIWC